METYKKLIDALGCIREKTDFVPRVALVLGSGLGDYADECVDIHSTVSFRDIGGFPVSTAEGHKGRFVFGYAGEVPVVVMQGRVHIYEGYSAKDVVMPIRLMGLLGAQLLFLTNASGSVNAEFDAGDFMVIRSQISSFAPSPLIGANIDQLGVRFPDMSEIYGGKLVTAIHETANELDIKTKEGVYLQFTGPQFETPEEVKMARLLGADAVGMSTAVEAIAARHMGMQVCGISCITNLGAGLSDSPLSGEEVFETANRVAPQFKALVTGSVQKLNNLL